MLHSVNGIINFSLLAEDGEVGRCKDFLFDARPWVIRYMVADTGQWLFGRKVLILPAALGKPDVKAQRLTVNFPKKQIENAPDLDTDAPVSRQYEILYHTFYRMPYYWNDPVAPEIRATGMNADLLAKPHSDSANLRSAVEVTGYSIQTSDGELGHVADFILDDETWNLNYLVVDAGKWLPGKKFLVTPGLLGAVDWVQNSVTVHMTRDQLKKSPEYDAAIFINPQ